MSIYHPNIGPKQDRSDLTHAWKHENTTSE